MADDKNDFSSATNDLPTNWLLIRTKRKGRGLLLFLAIAVVAAAGAAAAWWFLLR